jgi:hypothetical protein
MPPLFVLYNDAPICLKGINAVPCPKRDDHMNESLDSGTSSKWCQVVSLPTYSDYPLWVKNFKTRFLSLEMELLRIGDILLLEIKTIIYLRGTLHSRIAIPHLRCPHLPGVSIYICLFYYAVIERFGKVPCWEELFVALFPVYHFFFCFHVSKVILHCKHSMRISSYWTIREFEKHTCDYTRKSMQQASLGWDWILIRWVKIQRLHRTEPASSYL